MTARHPDMKRLVQHTDFENLDIITANMKLLKANLEVLLDQTRPQQTRLKKALADVAGQYDFCVIDNAPDINISTINALVASNDVIVPLEVDDNTTEAGGTGGADRKYPGRPEPGPYIQRLLYHQV